MLIIEGSLESGSGTNVRNTVALAALWGEPVKIPGLSEPARQSFLD
jgi:RNA 3'-terminal phosphate cyclase